jgi:enoyl-CoA hydratase
MIDGERLSPDDALRLGLVGLVPDEGGGLPVEEALRREEKGVADLTLTADAAEGLQAFLDKRPAVFRGR